MTEEELTKLATLVAEKATRPHYLSREAVATELGVSRPTLLKLEAEEGAPVHWLGGNLYRYLRSELDEWIAARPKKRDAA